MAESEEYQAKKAAARANLGFYRAFESLDIEAMNRVWLPDDRIKCVHPGWELLVGRERVLTSWEAIFRNTENIRFDVSDVTIEIVQDCAWVTAIENIETSTEESRYQSQAVATNLFVWSEGRYQMILHHASPVAQRGFNDLME